MTLRPLHDFIVVQVIKADSTVGGILLPDAAREAPSKGKILSVGNGKILENGELIPVSVKVGDTVMFARDAGILMKVDGEEFTFMRESDILAVVE